MPRIPDADVARLKQMVPLTDLAAAAGVTLVGQGHNLVGRCPFHDDRTPSLVIDPGKNLWHCLGACQAGGSNVDWVMRAQGVGFREACDHLAALAGGGMIDHASAPASTAAPADARRLANPFTAQAQGEVLLGQVAELYHRTLLDDPLATASPAMAYLAARKIADPTLLRQFRLGCADRSLGLRLPEKNRRAGAEIRVRLAQVGVLKPSGHEWLSGALTIPIVDPSGATVGLYGRMITPNLRPGTILHRYLPGPHRAAWNAGNAVNAEGAVIVCEALIDALTLWAHGHPHVTAAYGVNGFTEFHRALCGAASVRSVFIAYDHDEAGNRAAATLADELIRAGKTVYRVLVPATCKDLNGLACASEDASAALAAVLHDAALMGGAVRITVPEPTEKTAAQTAATAAANEQQAAATDDVPVVALSEKAGLDDEPPFSPLAALPLSAPAPGPTLQRVGDDHRIAFGNRHYRIRALLKNADLSALKIGLRLTVGEIFHHDTLDWCQAKQRMAFISAAAELTKANVDALRADAAQVLDACESAWLAARQTTEETKKTPTMTPQERAEALALLSDPNLLTRIAEDFATCGLVGDPAPKLVSYLCAVSRKLAQPLAVLTMAPSATGKSSLQDATLSFVPEEDRLVLSTLTGQALYYSDTDLRHKVLAIAEEEGASRASYALKLLQSDGKLTLAVPIKDAESGQISTQIKTVHGPVALFLTTTAPQIDDELANRCIVLTVDESAEHTARVHTAQRERETLAGFRQATAASAIRTRHHHAQRLLEAIAVVNPFAPVLTFRCDRARMRRDHQKYLGLMRALTFLHQHQRPRRTTVVDGVSVSYIETTLADVAAANDLAAAVLGRSLDELAPQTRTLLMRIDALVSARAAAQAQARETIRFTRREVRDATLASANQVRDHLARLVEMEYVVPVRGSGQGQRQEYVLWYDGQGVNGESFMLGLADLATIERRMQQGQEGSIGTGTTPTLSPQTPDFVPTLSPLCPHFVRGVWSDKSDKSAGENRGDSSDEPETEKNEHGGGIRILASDRSRSRSATGNEAGSDTGNEAGDQPLSSYANGHANAHANGHATLGGVR